MMINPIKHGLVFQQMSNSNKSSPLKLVGWIVAVLWLGLSGIAQAQVVLPQGGNVASGAVIITPTDSSTLTIDQSSATAIVNWNNFSIGTGGHVNIIQPTENSVILNRVTGNTSSEIHGRLTATGQVHLVNPNGIFIGPNGSVNAGGFAASTLDISDKDLNAGRLRYGGTGDSATVENAGRITIGRGGYAALIGGLVRNSGTVVVPMGRIGFAAGELVTLDVSGDQFLQVALPSGSEDDGLALIENTGTARAEGGLIEMRAATARNAARYAINMSGVAEASSVSEQGGTIILGGGTGGHVTVSGRVSTRAARLDTTVVTSPRPMGRGGQVTITGNQITLNGAQIDASGDAGGGLINIGGDFAGVGPLQRAGYLSVDNQTLITADALDNGAGGRIAAWSDLSTEFAGILSARGGDVGGDGGFIEVSSRQKLSYSGSADLRAPLGLWGTLLLDPYNIIIGVKGAAGVTTTATSLANSLATADVTLKTSTKTVGKEKGYITIDADIAWNSGSMLKLDADTNITINGDLTAAAGKVKLITNADIVLNGAIKLKDFVIGETSNAADITTGSGGTVDVDLFKLNYGNWSQVGSKLPKFNATNFKLGSSSTFLRAVGGDGTKGTPYLLTDDFGLQGSTSTSLSGTEFLFVIDSFTSNLSGTPEASGSAISGVAEGFSIETVFNDDGKIGKSKGGTNKESVSKESVSKESDSKDGDSKDGDSKDDDSKDDDSKDDDNKGDDSKDGGDSSGGSLVEAKNTLRVVEDVASQLKECLYLGCLSGSLGKFANVLDNIDVNLSPGMSNVASIVQDARVKIDQARTRARSRLENAVSDAERQTIRRDEINEARAALSTAANEIRKAILLVRADDPELATVQRATVIAVANAIDSVGIKLSRAVDL